MTKPKSLQDLDYIFFNFKYIQNDAWPLKGEAKRLEINSVLLGALISAISKLRKCFIH